MLLLQRLAWACVSGLSFLLLSPLLDEPLGWTPVTFVAGLATLAALRLHDAFLVFAALSPLAAVTFLLVRAADSTIRFEEAVTLAFLAGWAARRSIRPRKLPISDELRWSAALLVTATVVSGIVTGGSLIAEQPGASAVNLLWTRLVRESMLRSSPFSGALLLIEGLLLLIAAGDACAGDPEKRDRAIRAMVLSAAAAAIINLLRLATASLRTEHPWSSLLQYLATVRVNVHFGDLNASASYFAMLLFFALGLVPRWPRIAYPCAAVIALAMWMSGSRIALAAVVITAALGALLWSHARSGRLARGVAGVCLLLAITAFAWWKWYPEGRNVDQSYAFAFRVEMATAGLRMAAAAPLWGIGVGRFHAASGEYASVRENAHNQFIQVLAELGIPGLLLFVAVLVFALRETWRAPGPPGPSWGLLAGLGVFLLTSLGGHPLLVHGAAYPFWMALGLAAAPITYPRGLRHGVRLLPLVLLALFIASVPYRVNAAARSAYLEHASVGMSQWHRDADGYRYRFAGGRSSLFVAASAQSVRIPLQHGPLAPRAVEIRIFLDGREADRVVLTRDDGWRTVRLLPARQAQTSFRRIDLEATMPGSATPLDVQVTNSAGAIMVGTLGVQ